MSSNDNRFVLLVLAAVAAAIGVGIAAHHITWLREHHTDISLVLLLLILAGSGSAAAIAALLNLTPPTTTTDDDTDTDTESSLAVAVAPGTEGIGRPHNGPGTSTDLASAGLADLDDVPPRYRSPDAFHDHLAEMCREHGFVFFDNTTG